MDFVFFFLFFVALNSDLPMQEAPAAAAAATAPNNGAHPKRPEKERPKGHSSSSSSKDKDKAPKRKRDEAPANGEKSEKTEKAEPEFACRVKYRNTLPELPFDPKLRYSASLTLTASRYSIRCYNTHPAVILGPCLCLLALELSIESGSYLLIALL